MLCRSSRTWPRYTPGTQQHWTPVTFLPAATRYLLSNARQFAIAPSTIANLAIPLSTQIIAKLDGFSHESSDASTLVTLTSTAAPSDESIEVRRSNSGMALVEWH